MGMVYQHIRLSNFAKPELEDIDARALVDTGALELCIPRHVALQLRLEKVADREVTTADGGKHLVDYVGPIKVECFGRAALVGALVLGNQVLLGAVPMETMDLLVDPRRLQLIPNPENPNIPGALAMGVQSVGRVD